MASGGNGFRKQFPRETIRFGCRALGIGAKCSIIGWNEMVKETKPKKEREDKERKRERERERR